MGRGGHFNYGTSIDSLSIYIVYILSKTITARHPEPAHRKARFRPRHPGAR